jgi:hypothetical protein
MSLCVHGWKEQSAQATYARPSRPIAALGSGAARSPVCGRYEAAAIPICAVQVAPPSSERSTESLSSS